MSLKIVVIGGVAGGATAAAKARRCNEDATIEVYERGQYVSYANCGLPYWIGREIEDSSSLLLMDPEKFWSKYRVRVHLGHEALSIDPDRQTVTVKSDSGKEIEVSYDKLILSQGALPIRLPVPGTDLPHVASLRSVEDMFSIDAKIHQFQVRQAVVAGGGFIGLEMAEALMHRGIEVTVLERQNHVMPMLDPDIGAEFQKRLIDRGLRILSSTSLTGIDNNQVTLSDGSTLISQLVILAAGVKPEIDLARQANLKLGEAGGISVNDSMLSSDPNIYAVGDMVEVEHKISGKKVRMPLAGPANRQGRVAGSNASGTPKKYGKVLGTSIVRCLSEVCASTGLNLMQARAAFGDSVRVSLSYDPNHASYYPGSNQILTKLIWNAKDGKILGAQILGMDGVDRRIDVISVAMAGGLAVEDLEGLDLAYAPPFGSANDPVNVAGFVASNLRRGESVGIVPEDLIHLKEPYQIVDVREDMEHRQGVLEGALLFPLSKLRETHESLPKNILLVTCCRKGQRGYLAERILRQKGFTVKNLLGGFMAAQRAGLPIESARTSASES